MRRSDLRSVAGVPSARIGLHGGITIVPTGTSTGRRGCDASGTPSFSRAGGWNEAPYGFRPIRSDAA
ncbi:hypothetical protein [Methylobacterium platani]|uniref:Uncharacterized protein n=2 Tax=Methylobacterium platani TaxID=427683 RepID=A0A179SG81_9HYPH|nr:hypothetical protein [Methylobacterium platani]KMO14116.1 hypothetical protein SQ03_20110 [Methylobacterium platani JCM 14648]OAS26848.1 hypothetical protein A5481_03820 [Methylobacterium platani]